SIAAPFVGSRRSSSAGAVLFIRRRPPAPIERGRRLNFAQSPLLIRGGPHEIHAADTRCCRQFVEAHDRRVASPLFEAAYGSLTERGALCQPLLRQPFLLPDALDVLPHHPRDSPCCLKVSLLARSENAEPWLIDIKSAIPAASTTAAVPALPLRRSPVPSVA